MATNSGSAGWEAIQRGILGVLLAVVGLFGLGAAPGLLEGEYVSGGAGALLAVGAGYWIGWLFLDGLRSG